jgi:asparagine synthase (glutamine-hydrolysing)
MKNQGVLLLTKEEIPFTIKGPLTVESPVYVYYHREKEFLLTSKDLKELFNHPLFPKKLKILPFGVTFFLQYGFVPTPYTIFQDLYVLSVGDSVRIELSSGKIKLHFTHEFLYFNALRDNSLEPDIELILSLLDDSVLKRWDGKAPLVLFQSLGKDSNTIALALAKAGLKEEVICVTLSTGDRKDESEVARGISQKLGFKHYKLPVPPKLDKSHLEELERYFERIILPCGDGVSIAYPLYTFSFDFSGKILLDGSGNDIYFGHIPRKIEYFRQKHYSLLSFLKPFSQGLKTGNPLQKISLFRCEYPFYHLLGLTLRDCREIYPEAEDWRLFLKNWDSERKNWDYFDLKADLWGTHAEYALVTQKVRNFSQAYDLELLFPWCYEPLATYVAKLPEKYLFDRKTFKNKLLLRKLLKETLELDSDVLGKYSYGFDVYKLLKSVSDYVKECVLSCPLWHKRGIEKLWKRIESHSDKNKLYQRIYIRLYLLSSWFHFSRYVVN